MRFPYRQWLILIVLARKPFIRNGEIHWASQLDAADHDDHDPIAPSCRPTDVIISPVEMLSEASSGGFIAAVANDWSTLGSALLATDERMNDPSSGPPPTGGTHGRSSGSTPSTRTIAIRTWGSCSESSEASTIPTTTIGEQPRRGIWGWRVGQCCSCSTLEAPKASIDSFGFPGSIFEIRGKVQGHPGKNHTVHCHCWNHGLLCMLLLFKRMSTRHLHSSYHCSWQAYGGFSSKGDGRLMVCFTWSSK